MRSASRVRLHRVVAAVADDQVVEEDGREAVEVVARVPVAVARRLARRGTRGMPIR
jgi:hypothetical protein